MAERDWGNDMQLVDKLSSEIGNTDYAEEAHDALKHYMELCEEKVSREDFREAMKQAVSPYSRMFEAAGNLADSHYAYIQEMRGPPPASSHP